MLIAWRKLLNFTIVPGLFDSFSAVVMMVVQPGERNAFDQRHIEQTLFEKLLWLI